MPFQLTVRMSGVVAIANLDATGNAPRYRVILPDTLLGTPRPGPHNPARPANAPDNRPLHRHDPQLRYVAYCKPDVDTAWGPVESLRGSWLRFDWGGNTTNPLSPGVVKLGTGAAALASMQRIVGQGGCRLAQGFTTSPPAAAGVMAAFDIDVGELEAIPTDTGSTAVEIDTFPASASPAHSGRLPWKLHWIVRNLSTEFSLVFRDLTTGAERTVRFDRDQDVCLDIVSPASPGRAGQQLVSEELDFLWYYRLLATPPAIRPPATLPVPREPGGGKIYRSAARPNQLTVGSQYCRPCEFCI